MSDLNLNAQLGGRLKALQRYWNHDTASETLATVFDICVNRWGVGCPNLPQVVADKGFRVTLKTRHVAYFTSMAQLAGCSVADIARSMLIQWLCAASAALLPTSLTLLPQNPTRPIPQLPPTRVKKAPKKVKQSPSVVEPTPTTVMIEPTPPVVEPVKPLFDAKASLLALKRG